MSTIWPSLSVTTPVQSAGARLGSFVRAVTVHGARRAPRLAPASLMSGTSSTNMSPAESRGRCAGRGQRGGQDERGGTRRRDEGTGGHGKLLGCAVDAPILFLWRR